MFIQQPKQIDDSSDRFGLTAFIPREGVLATTRKVSFPLFFVPLVIGIMPPIFSSADR